MKPMQSTLCEALSLMETGELANLSRGADQAAHGLKDTDSALSLVLKAVSLEARTALLTRPAITRAVRQD
jgi:hypothetical protein